MPLKDIFFEKREEKGLTIEEVVEETGIPARFVHYIEEGKYNQLPPDAYVYGYLRKISILYSLDIDEIWEQYKKEKGELFRSGATDHFPGSQKMEQERSTFDKKKLLYVLPVLLVVGVVGYIGWQASGLLKPPELTVLTPAEDIVVQDESLTVIGFTDPRNTVTINGENILLNNEGEFEKMYTLQEGMNVFTFRAKKLLGKETELSRRVVYEPSEGDQLEEGTATSSSPVSTSTDATSTDTSNKQP